MSAGVDPCGPCAQAPGGPPALAPVPPGLDAIPYRVGTHGAFKAAMEVELAAAVPGLPTRADDDPAIALVDGWAAVLDVLTFYQERIANEGYLRTATERASVVELARAIGYAPRPGVAASVDLAFQLETAPGSPGSVTLPAGTRAQSVPGPGEQPQVFETVADLEARPGWNALLPRQGRPVAPALGDTSLLLDGTATGLRPGDALLFAGRQRSLHPRSQRWELRPLRAVETDPARKTTLVTWDRPLGHRRARGRPPLRPSHRDLGVFPLRTRAGVFGHNAPDWRAMPDAVKASYGGVHLRQWPKFTITVTGRPDTIDLDGVYPELLPGRWVVLSAGGYARLFRVARATTASRTDFTLTARTSRARLEGEHLGDFARRLRETVVWIAGDALTPVDVPIALPVAGDRLELADATDLPAGRTVIVSGRSAADGAPLAEAATVVRTAHDDPAHAELRLAGPLAGVYDRASVAIAANVAPATHGQTRQEVLGSGDGSRSFQTFDLKQSPLTYVPAPTPAGAASTLEVRVGDVAWEEVPGLYGHGGDERIYVTRIADGGRVTVEWGDGGTGARLPTGVENVTATYRVGTGLAGMVRAGQITQPMTRPLGLRSVTNPVAPAGAADPESLAGARQNAPLGVLTLDRVVSLTDYEDFGRAFAGIAKSLATWAWDGESRLVHLTLVAVGGGPPAPSTSANLLAALLAAGDPRQRVRIDGCEARTFDVAATLTLETGRDPGRTRAEAAAALLDAFGFERRALGQPVAASEVVAALQGVAGVAAVDLTGLAFTGEAARVAPILLARAARWEGGRLLPAQLLTVRPAGIALGTSA